MWEITGQTGERKTDTSGTGDYPMRSIQTGGV